MEKSQPLSLEFSLGKINVFQKYHSEENEPECRTDLLRENSKPRTLVE